MKVGGGLNYVVGPMGAGKTFYGVRRIAEALIGGKYVVTNVELRPGWAPMIAKHISRTGSQAKRSKIATQLQRGYIYEEELSEAQKYRLPGAGEARGVFIWDEGQNVLNNRDWKADGRRETLMWATQLRKLGFVGFLLSQHQDNTDAALRRVCNFLIRLQNQKEQTRLLGVRITPWPLFLAVWMPANSPLVSKQKPVRVERYVLSWHRKLYDTHGLFHGLAATAEENDGLVHLPALAPAKRAKRAAGAPASVLGPSNFATASSAWARPEDVTSEAPAVSSVLELLSPGERLALGNRREDVELVDDDAAPGEGDEDERTPAAWAWHKSG